MAAPAATRSGGIHAQPWLGIYLNDHLAAAAAGVGVARRMARKHRHSVYGGELARLTTEFVQDRRSLLWCMVSLGVPVRHTKLRAALTAERAVRLPSRGRRQRTGVNTLVGLEALRMGVEGKALLWRSLLAVAVHDTRLQTGRLSELLERAGNQLTTLDSLHSRTTSALISPEDPA
ncbi:hypothetical protein GTZ89_12505 [Streptomyces sp. SID8382]|uniref:hypothetical protein n=1 Tax=Streptomyces malaysiensis TaxID=92644 RepID=UPI000C2C989A|nr:MULTISPECIES: hypothetical protein [unclassified Streptomyces]AUA15786.1 hypothetical protein CFP59_07976 [Streptomyces sp. M56]MYX56499.1 hypothetical protein [Streptomyces sp. SID8382]